MRKGSWAEGEHATATRLAVLRFGRKVEAGGFWNENEMADAVDPGRASADDDMGKVVMERKGAVVTWCHSPFTALIDVA